MDIIERWTAHYRDREYETVKYQDGSLAYLIDGMQFTRLADLWIYVRTGDTSTAVYLDRAVDATNEGDE